MKKLTIIICLLIAFNISLFAQTDCLGGRFLDSLYTVDVTSNVTYGHNYNYLGVYSTLRMDIYQPHNDVAIKRPLIIIAPGGSFLVESKIDYPTRTLCRRLAEMGYVTAAIDYRVGVNSPTASEFSNALLRGTHDFRAAVRFFKMDASTTNSYKIDTNLIVAGGSSAGAFSALHLAYLDKIPEIISTGIDTTGLGGVEGLSGNQGYSSKVKYIIDLCGAIGDTSWIEQGNNKVISLHGDNDNIVPYATDTISVSGIGITKVDGSASIKNRCDHIGIENSFYTFKGAGHTPYDVTFNATEYSYYMDTTIAFIRDNLYNWICGSITNVPDIENSNSITIAPDPFIENAEVITTQAFDNACMLIFDITGKEVARYENLNGTNIFINRKGLASGIYFYKLFNKNKLLISVGKIAAQ